MGRKLLVISALLAMLNIGRAQNVDVSATSGTLSGSYSTIKAAFDAINSGTHQGVIGIAIVSNTSESGTAILNGSGSGSANYSSVSIYPDGGAWTISGTISGGIIQLNGADNVTIDGLNSSGNSLTISNASTSSPGYTIALDNDAYNNSLRNLTVTGSSPCNGAYGVIYFGSGGTTTGNDNNLIEYCNIGPTGSNLPAVGVGSAGTSSFTNSNNTVQYCNIYDYHNASSANGIYLNTYSDDWTIVHNRFYQTATRSCTNASGYYGAIHLNGESGHLVENNIIGFANSSGTGVMQYTPDTSGCVYFGIYVEGTTSSQTTINLNVINGIKFTSSTYNINFRGIYINSTGGTNYADITNNTIGTLTDTSSIVLLTTGKIDLYPISFASNSYNNNSNISGNNIGSINSGTSNPSSCYGSGIYIMGSSSSTLTVSGNTIGASGHTISPGTTSASGQYQLSGITISTTAAINISENTISYIYENSTGTSLNYARGIHVVNTSASQRFIQNNTISYIVSRSGYSSSGERAATGIYVECSGSGDTLSLTANTIHHISYDYGAAVNNSTCGISIPGNTPMKISGNFIYDIDNNSTYSWSSSSYDRQGIFGIEMINSTGSYLVSISNNFIYLTANNGGTPICTPINGIALYSASEAYYNTVIVAGTACSSGGSTINSTCLTGGQYLNIPVKNNIFYNVRSGNGRHYAIMNDGYSGYSTTSYTFYTDYNIYYTNDTNKMGRFGVANKSFSAWKSTIYNSGSGPQVDLNSQFADPSFKSVSSMDFKLQAGSPAVAAGTAITGIDKDYYGTTRSTSTPNIGAYENEPIFDWHGSTSTDWNTASNWGSSVVPPNNANIRIPSAGVANTLQLPSDKTVKDLTLDNNTYSFDLNNYKLTITGDLTQTGTAAANGVPGTLHLNGTYAQTIPSGLLNLNSIQNLMINNSAGITAASSVFVTDTIFMYNGNYNGASMLEMADSIIFIRKSGALDQEPTFDGWVSLIYEGTSALTSGHEIPYNTGYLMDFTMNNSGGLTLTSMPWVFHALNLVNGRILLGNNDFIMDELTDVNGASSSSFLVINGTGKFMNVACIPSSTRIFPVGHTNSASGFCPVTLHFNAGHTRDDYTISAMNKITSNGTSTGTVYTNEVVKTTWNISEFVAGGSDIDITLQWNASDEGTSLNHADMHLYHYNAASASSNKWEIQGASALTVSGSGPYSVTYSGYTGGFSPFGLGNNTPTTPLPLNDFQLSGRAENTSNVLLLFSQTENDIQYYELEKSLDGNTFSHLARINSTMSRNYNYSDAVNEMVAQVCYYQVWIYHFNGSRTYGGMIRIARSASVPYTLQLFPNPVTDNATLNFGRELDTETDYYLSDISGKIIRKGLLPSGSQTMTLNLSDLPSGTYFVSIGNNTKTILIKN